MDKGSYSQLASLRKARTSEPGQPQDRIMPFGPYGGGQITGHPIGIVIVIGFIAMALVGIPEARGFFAVSLALGVAFGVFLWLHHQSKSAF